MRRAIRVVGLVGGLMGCGQIAEPSEASVSDGGSDPRMLDAATANPSEDGPVECPARATSTVSVRANIADDSYALSFIANDAAGVTARFRLAFEKSSHRSWDYRVTLIREEAGAALGSGSVSFNKDGSLALVQVDQPLRFPAPSADPTQLIELDFGKPRIGDGGGDSDVASAGGLTSLAAPSVVLEATEDGHTASSSHCDPAQTRYDALLGEPQNP